MFEIKIAGYSISIKQTNRKIFRGTKDRFTVTYGKQVSKKLSYNEAAQELGACIMHALCCEGKLGNEDSNDNVAFQNP